MQNYDLIKIKRLFSIHPRPKNSEYGHENKKIPFFSSSKNMWRMWPPTKLFISKAKKTFSSSPQNSSAAITVSRLVLFQNPFCWFWLFLVFVAEKMVVGVLALQGSFNEHIAGTLLCFLSLCWIFCLCLGVY